MITEINKKTHEELGFSPEFKSVEQAEGFIKKIRSINVKEYLPDCTETIDSTFRIYKMPGKEFIKEL